MKPDKSILRQIPQIDALLKHPHIAPLAMQCSDGLAARAAQSCTERLRAKLLCGEAQGVDREALVEEIAAEILSLRRPVQRSVINATGILLHTNLGRAVLDETVAEQVKQAAMQYTTLEYDLASGMRGDRSAPIEALLCAASGAEAAFAVNNNAAAVLLMLTAIAAGREVIVSRGELVEIGGSFRVPEIMAQSGARLVEVGSTNKTRVSDYGAAIDEARTAALLKVHASNFKMIGFTEETPLAELARLGRARGIPVLYDAGSASLLAMEGAGIYGQTSVAECIRDGADVICFSGDKLLGGPQAGIILGKKELVERMKRHPLARALRMDKLTLTALEGTLRLYRSPSEARRRIPVLAMLSLTVEELRERGERLLAAAREGGCVHRLSLCETAAQTGGGSAPCEELPSLAVCAEAVGCSAAALERALRLGDPPVIARVSKERVLLDLRTVRECELSLLAARLCE